MTRKSVFLALLFCMLTAFVPSAPAQQCTSHQTGSFDYYLLTLSWSPEFCFSRNNRDKPECQQHHGFVLHGLWPQLQDGNYPCDCGQTSWLASSLSATDIYSDPGLVRHEWQKHGTCTGLSAQNYFNTVRHALQVVKVPQQLQSPSRQQWSSPGQVKQWFMSANPGLQADNLAVQCRRGFLEGVEACLDKNLHPIACQVREDCTDSQLRIAPIR